MDPGSGRRSDEDAKVVAGEGVVRSLLFRVKLGVEGEGVGLSRGGVVDKLEPATSLVDEVLEPGP